MALSCVAAESSVGRVLRLRPRVRLMPCAQMSTSAAPLAERARAAASKGIGGSLVAWASQPAAARGRLPLGTDAWLRWSFDVRAVATFAALAGDDNPVHVDADFAARTRFGAPIVHGMLAASLWGTLLGATVPGSIYVSQRVAFTAPVFVGEQITARLAVTALDTGGRRAICATRIEKADGSVAAEGEAVVLLPRGAGGEEGGAALAAPHLQAAVSA